MLYTYMVCLLIPQPTLYVTVWDHRVSRGSTICILLKRFRQSQDWHLTPNAVSEQVEKLCIQTQSPDSLGDENFFCQVNEPPYSV